MDNFAAFINGAISESLWTPDVPVIESQDDWYVFVYNNRRGKSSGYFTHIDSDAEFVGIGWTKSNVYSILNVEDSTRTYQLADVTGTDRILGEVWKVPSEMLLDLDSLECNQLVSRRIPVPIIVRGSQEITAWIYTTRRSYLIEGGIRTSKHTACTYINNERFLEI